MFKKKFKIILVRKEFQTINVLKTLFTNRITESFSYTNKTFVLKPQIPFMNDGIQKVYVIDYDSGNQLKFEEIQAQLNPSELDMILSNNIIKQLTSGALDSKEKIIMAIFGLIVGALMGVVGMMFYYQSKIDEIYASLNITMEGIIPI